MSHLTSHSQRLRWSSSGPSTRSGYPDGTACSFIARAPLMTGIWAPGGAVFKVSRGPPALPDGQASVDRGGAEAIPAVRNPEVPRTDLLLRPTLLAPAPPRRNLGRRSRRARDAGRSALSSRRGEAGCVRARKE